MNSPLYFGCARGVWGNREAGHYFYRCDGRSVRLGDRATPFGYVDGKLAPRKWAGRSAPEEPQGVAALHHKDGWTALAFWDRSGDGRGNSSSTFLIPSEVSFDVAVSVAREAFPDLFARFDFEIRPRCG